MTAPIANTHGIDVRAHVADLSGGDLDDIVGEANLITASALFDLISPDVIRSMVATIASVGRAFYTKLSPEERKLAAHRIRQMAERRKRKKKKKK